MISGSLILVGIIILLTLAFDFVNGFHDTANSIATAVTTRSLTPVQAIIMAASFDFLGALSNTKVAATVGKGIVDSHVITLEVLISALFAAIIWNIITWYFGIPSSSSHALIGGLVGSAVSKTWGLQAVYWKSLLFKIILPLLLSPVLGLLAGALFMLILMWILKPFKPDKINKVFSKLQVLSSAFVAFSHGGNDAQKSMGIITLALLSGGFISEFNVPWKVTVACAIALAAGTATGGWKIIKTMGNKIAKLNPVNGFAAQAATTAVINSATFLIGAPVSTTHIISTSIMGVGATKRFSAVKWGIAKDLIFTWLITIPTCALLAGILFRVIDLVL